MTCKTVKKVYKNGWINKQKIECNETNQHCFEIRIGNFIKEPINYFGYLQKHITIFWSSHFFSQNLSLQTNT